MKSRRPKNSFHNYCQLETRNLLATTGLSQFDGDQSIDAGLVINGSFDATEVDGATSEHVLISEIEGWNQTAGASDTASLVGFDDSPRLTGLHLDAQANVLESVYQDISAESGQLYTLAFDLRGRSAGDDASADTNDIEVLWDGQALGNFRGSTEIWQSFTVDVTGGESAVTRLEIREVEGTGNDGIGALLDNIRLVPVAFESVDNGSFEDSESGIIADTAVDHWSVIGDTDNRLLDVRSDDASDGSQFVNLDRQSNDSDILYSDVTTEEGAVYFLSFDLRSESGETGSDEEIRVRWNNEWVGTYLGSADWQGHGFTVVADSDSTRLVFREPGDDFTGDGSGPLLDNVRLTRVIPSISLSLSDSTPFEFTENDAALTIGTAVEGLQSTVVAAVTSISVSLPANADLASESLRFDSLLGEQNFTDGVLTVTGDLSDEEFLSVLQTLGYENTSEDTEDGQRVVEIAVASAEIDAVSETLIVNVTAVNDAPVLSEIDDIELETGDSLNTTAIANDVDNEELTWTVSASGTAVVGSQPTIDNGTISWTAAAEGTATVTIRASDTGGLFDETSFIVTVTDPVALDTGTILVNAGSALSSYDSTLAADPAVGETIADFDAQTIHGGEFNSLETGVARIYSALAHWCPACQTELPEISEWLQENDLGADIEFVAAAVAVDSSRDNYPPADWFETESFSGTVIVDTPTGTLLDLFGTATFPFLVAVDANGTVVERISGATTSEQLDEILSTLRS